MELQTVNSITGRPLAIGRTSKTTVSVAPGATSMSKYQVCVPNPPTGESSVGVGDTVRLASDPSAEDQTVEADALRG